MEETKKVGNIILTIVVLLALGFGIYYLVSRNDTSDTSQQPVAGSNYYVSVVQVKHQFKNGTHTYVGSIDLPNGCYTLDAELKKTNDTEGVIALQTTENTEEMCAQSVTTRSFRVETSAPMNFAVVGILNSRPVELNIFEVPAAEDIDAFEINIKG